MVMTVAVPRSAVITLTCCQLCSFLIGHSGQPIECGFGVLACAQLNFGSGSILEVALLVWVAGKSVPIAFFFFRRRHSESMRTIH